MASNAGGKGESQIPSAEIAHYLKWEKSWYLAKFQLQWWPFELVLEDQAAFFASLSPYSCYLFTFLLCSSNPFLLPAVPQEFTLFDAKLNAAPKIKFWVNIKTFLLKNELFCMEYSRVDPVGANWHLHCLVLEFGDGLERSGFNTYGMRELLKHSPNCDTWMTWVWIGLRGGETLNFRNQPLVLFVDAERSIPLSMYLYICWDLDSLEMNPGAKQVKLKPSSSSSQLVCCLKSVSCSSCRSFFKPELELKLSGSPQFSMEHDCKTGDTIPWILKFGFVIQIFCCLTLEKVTHYIIW